MKRDYEKLNTHDYVWIGSTNKSREEFLKYFELDCEHELGDPEYIPCGFCRDCGEKWYDEDFLYIEGPLEKEVPIVELLKYAIVSDRDKDKIIQKCNELGISKANTIIGYGTPDDYMENGCFHVSKPYKNSYNGLKFIGKFSH